MLKTETAERAERAEHPEKTFLGDLRALCG